MAPKTESTKHEHRTRAATGSSKPRQHWQPETESVTKRKTTTKKRGPKTTTTTKTTKKTEGTKKTTKPKANTGAKVTKTKTTKKPNPVKGAKLKAEGAITGKSGKKVSVVYATRARRALVCCLFVISLIQDYSLC